MSLVVPANHSRGSVWGTNGVDGCVLTQLLVCGTFLGLHFEVKLPSGFLTTLPHWNQPRHRPESILTVAVPEPSRMSSRILLVDFEGS